MDLVDSFRLGQSLDLLQILLYSVFLVNAAMFLLFIKAACCKNCIMSVSVIKQEIAERERGLEEACGAEWTFYISRALLSKTSRLCICLSDASVWRCVWLCVGIWMRYDGQYWVDTTVSSWPSNLWLKKKKQKRRKTMNLSLWVSSYAPDYLTVLENQGMNLESRRVWDSSLGWQFLIHHHGVQLVVAWCSWPPGFRWVRQSWSKQWRKLPAKVK